MIARGQWDGQNEWRGERETQPSSYGTSKSQNVRNTINDIIITDGSYIGSYNIMYTLVKSLSCTTETNVTLCVNYTQIKKIRKGSCFKKNRYWGSLGGLAVWCLPLAQGAILESPDRVPRRAPCMEPASLPLPVSLPACSPTLWVEITLKKQFKLLEMIALKLS